MPANAVSYSPNKAATVVPRRAVQGRLMRLDHRGIDSQRRVFEVLINPENDNMSEDAKAALAGMASRTWRKWRTQEVVLEALAARRAAYAQHLPEIDEALIRMAKTGSIEHIKLAYMRIEGWNPKLVVLQTSQPGGDPEMWAFLGEDGRRELADVLARRLRERGRAEPPLGAMALLTDGDPPRGSQG